MKKRLTGLLIVMLCLSVCSCFNKVKEVSADTMLTYLNDLMNKTNENDLNYSFTMTEKNKNLVYGTTINTETETKSTYDSVTSNYIYGVEVSEKKYEGAFLNQTYGNLFESLDGSRYIYDEAYVKNIVKRDLKEVYKEFQNYASLNEEEIKALIEQEKIDSQIQLEEEGKIVISVDIEMTYETLKDDKYVISYSKYTKSYNSKDVNPYEETKKFSYTFSKDRLYEVYSFSHDTEEKVESKITLAYVYDESIYNLLFKDVIVSSGQTKWKQYLRVYVDGKRVSFENNKDSEFSFGEDIDTILASTSEFQNNDIENIYYYNINDSYEDIPFRKYVSGTKTLSTAGAVIYATSNEEDNKAKIITNYFEITQNGYKKKTITLSDSNYEEVDLGTYTIKVNDGNHVFDEIITINGEKVNSLNIELNEKGTYVINCYLTTTRGANTPINYYIGGALAEESYMWRSNYNFSYDLSFPFDNKSFLNITAYKDKDLTIPFTSSDRINGAVDIYLKYELNNEAKDDSYLLIINKTVDVEDSGRISLKKISESLDEEYYLSKWYNYRSITINGEDYFDSKELLDELDISYSSSYSYPACVLKMKKEVSKKLYIIVMDYAW